MGGPQLRSYRPHTVALIVAAVLFLLSCLLLLQDHLLTVHAQSSAPSLDLSQPAAPRGAGHVAFAAEPQSVAAGRPATLLLHFRVDSGFHINSHTPKSEMLIPTKLAVEDMPAAAVSAVDFPHGQLYSFAFEPKEKLDVYTGDFLLTAHVTARPGQHTLKGALRYQACDASACYPPKLLAVEQPFTAK